MVNVEAVLGHRATLPCDISANRTDDRVQMVMWFQVSASKPLFTFDVRGRTFDEALTWSDAKALGPRAHFSASSRPAALTVDGVVLDDAGVYRCRADFSNSATRNSRVNLTVIVPPHSMAVYDVSGKKVNASIGPLLEGDNLVLKCEVRGGRPEPTVTWFANGRLMDGVVDASTPKVIVNRLDVHRVSRTHLNTTYRCQASNTRLIDPRHQDVRLDLKLKPLSVRLYPRPAHIPADEEVRFECVTVGSRPQAVVTWWKTRHAGRDEQHFGAPHVDTRDNETMAWSVLTFRPKAADNNATVRCHADNPHLDNVGLEDSFTLNVVHPPVVELHLGDTLNPSNIKEGDDVYFECSIHSNPPKHRITWFHNGQPVLHNLSQGVILSSKSLVLQRVARRQAGGYTCHASNERGNTTSRPVHLRVKFAPVCKTDGVVVVGAALQEHLRVRCRVAADPADAVSFFWQFNNSGNTYDVQESRPGPMTADLEYTALSERDYGTLACWAANEVGRQQEPCLFRVVQASAPGAVTNCSLLASGPGGQSGRVDVSCVPGHPGGLPQWFSLILLEPRSGRILFNSTTGEVDAEPQWSLDPSILASAVSAARAPVSLVVRAHNLKGQSAPAVLDDKLARAGIARQQIPDLILGGDGSGMVGVAAVVLGVLLPLGLVGLAVVVCIVRRRNALGLAAGLDNKVSHNGLQGPGQGHGHKGGLPSSRRNSSLEINDGDQRYVVSYTLKASASGTPERGKQHLRPDILNTPRAVGGDAAPKPPTPQRPDSLFTEAGSGGAGAPGGLVGSLVGGTLGRRTHAVTTPISPGGGISPGIRSLRSQQGVVSSASLSSVPSPPDRAPPPIAAYPPPSLGTAHQTHQTLNGSLRRTKGLFNSIPGPESCV
ncbi:hemicentin-2-like [Thrips palmi]|uniref:Hemicentin-2-like n=1 Tax=Thrips palmi TaxID=161013 RepID=A0A6P8YGZ9_THRPL|nr:hemicentin-2-like [Thrips palmi]